MPAKLDQNQADLYVSGGMSNTYDLVPGTMVLPVAEEAPTDPVERAAWSPVVVVRAHAPYRLRTVQYSAEKHNSPPFVPSPKSNGVFTFLGASVSMPYPTLNLNGKPLWSMEGEYTFVSECYNDEGDGFVLGGMPFVLKDQLEEATTVSENSSAPEDVKQSGIGPQTGWVKGSQIDILDQTFYYNEPTFFPAVFLSDDIITGASAYI